MPDFYIEFNLKVFDELDNFALLACQKYNYGNENNWFNAFRGGLYGSYARIHGVVTHYYAIHAWVPRPRLPQETEYHLASIFFNMDSAIECITFAFNALGFCAAPQLFRDVTDVTALRRISPYDILGKNQADPPQPPLEGYLNIFPSVQEYWIRHEDILFTIFEQHDVSKHRETIFSGGMMRNDPPPGFYESLGISADASERAIFLPMKEIILRSEPKAPHAKRVSQRVEERVLLEDIAPQFRGFIAETGMMAIKDAKRNIKLKVEQLEKA